MNEQRLCAVCGTPGALLASHGYHLCARCGEEKPMVERIAELVDASSGGIKGTELLPKLIMLGCLDPADGSTPDLDYVAAVVRRELPAFDVLEYGMKIDRKTVRVKYFFHRTLHVCAPK